jgi:hypothetical protein
MSVHAVVMIAFTALEVSMTLMNDRRLTPAFAEASPAPQSVTIGRSAFVPANLIESARDFLGRRLTRAAVLAAGGIAAVGLTSVVVALSFGGSTTSALAAGPPASLRAAAGIGGSWEESQSMAVPPAEDLGAAVLAGRIETKERWESLARMKAAVEADNARKASEEAAAAAARRSNFQAAAPGPVRSYNSTSGYAPGTVLRSRVTVYGCTGPGGGFCGGMASGFQVFEGAAACSHNLPFGTKFRIHGDATGRTYECLDRGALGSTWVDIFFYNTTAGINWASNLGGTTVNIEILN